MAEVGAATGATSDSMPLPAETLAALFEASPNPYIIVAPDLTIAGANAAYMKATNKRPEELTGRYLFDAFPGSLESQLLLKDSFATVLANKEPHAVPLMRYDVPASSGDGTEERYWSTRHVPILDEDGNVAFILHHVTDVTGLHNSEDALRANEKQLRLMVAELNHRVKNTIAIILSIAARTARQSGTIEEFYGKYQSRLIALARTHDALNEAFWEGAQLCEIAAGELRAYDETRFTVDGPNVSLPPSTAVSVGLCIHELASNAAKYGALSNDAGRVRVTWRVEKADGTSTLVFSWTETGGPPVTPPTRRGFGSELIARSFSGPGESKLDFAKGGVVCEVRVKLGVKEDGAAGAIS
jgi:two-component sensor histidine kinase